MLLLYNYVTRTLIVQGNRDIKTAVLVIMLGGRGGCIKVIKMYQSVGVSWQFDPRDTL